MHKFLDKGEAIYVHLHEIDIIRKSEVNKGGSIVYTQAGNGFHTDTPPEEIAAMIDELSLATE